MDQRAELIKTIDEYTDDVLARDLHKADFSEKFADVLLADGWIRPPCKVGDKLYYIPFGKTVTECFVHAIEYEEKTIVIKCHMWDKERKGLLHKHLIYFDDNDFGKTVFPDPKEAKKALEERGKK